jgi:hypothetical protein
LADSLLRFKSGRIADGIRESRMILRMGEKHWQGAAPTTAMTDIAIQEALNGKQVEWMEKVSDTEYRKI